MRINVTIEVDPNGAPALGRQSLQDRASTFSEDRRAHRGRLGGTAGRGIDGLMESAGTTGWAICRNGGATNLVFGLVSLVSVWAGNWCYSCERIERVKEGDIVEIASVHVVFTHVAEKMVG